MATFEEIISDQDFKGLPNPERTKVLDQLFPDFAQLPQQEKSKVLDTIAGDSAQEKNTPTEPRKPHGVGGSFNAPRGFFKTTQGQLQIKAPQFLEEQPAFRAGQALVGGVSRIIRGAVPLPLDMAAALGSDKADAAADILRKNIPEIPANTTMDEIAQTLVQYGLPASTAIKWVNGVLSGSSAPIKWIAGILTGGATDFAASLPKEGTLGDVIGGPTKTKAGESTLTRKAKIGAEGVAIPAAVGGAISGVHRLGQKVGAFLKPMVMPTAGAKKAVSTGLKKMVVNAEDAIKNIDESMELTSRGFEPTSGIASRDPGLIAFEKGVSTHRQTSPWLRERFNQNKRAVASQLELLTQHADETTPVAATKYYTAYFDDLMDQAQSGLETTKSGLVGIQDEAKNYIAEVMALGGKQADASEIINEVITNELKSITRTKNALFRGIDPDNMVRIPKWRLSNALKRMITPLSELDSTPEKLPKDLVGRIANKLRVDDTSTFLTFGELQDLRPDLSEAIATARQANQGGVVERLVKFKNAVEDEAVYLAETGDEAGKKALRALNYYQDVYKPRFKKYVGDKFRKATRRGAPFAPTETGKKFLATMTGARENANQLKLIIKESPDAVKAGVAIRQHFISTIADLMTDSSGKTNLDRLSRYLKSRPVKESLEQFPEIRREVLGYKNSLTKTVMKENRFAREVQAAKDALKKTQDDLKVSAARYFVSDDPVVAVGRAINSRNPIKEIDELVALAKKDPTGEALKGLKSSLNKFMYEQLTGTREVAGKVEVLQSKVSKMLDSPIKKKALGKLYTPQEVSQLEDIQKKLRMLDRINEQVTAGSPTAPLQQDINRARIVLASIYGIVKGRGIFAISGWIQRTLGIDPVEIGNRLMLDAMLNPEAAKVLLAPDTEASKKLLGDYIIKYRLTNLIRPKEGGTPQ